MKTVLREPLVHFLALGSLLFLLYAFVGGNPGDLPEQIVLTSGRIASLASGFAVTMQRQPSTAELHDLIREFVREEVCVREATKLGLDRDDAVIRSRLAEKMEFVVRDTLHVAEPTEDDLQRYYDENLAKFQTPARISFEQVFFSTKGRADAMEQARSALAKLSSAGGDSELSELGDGLKSDKSFEDADEANVATKFGEGFARAVLALQPGSWQGPIESTVGLHLVRVSKIQASIQFTFADVRAQVIDLWRAQRHKEETRKHFADLARKYVVVDENAHPVSIDSPATSAPAIPSGATAIVP